MLKKIMLLSALLFVNSKIVTAQSLSVGPIVGANLATINSLPNTKSIAGISGGGFANYSVDEHLGIGAKILYSQLGTAFSNSSKVVKLHYIQIPLSAIYYFGDNGNEFRPKVYAGPYLGTLLKAKDENGNEILRPDGTHAYNTFDLGGQVGLGFNYRIMPSTWINFDAGFAKSFTDVSKNNSNSYHNVAFSLNVGVSFPISGE